MPVEFHPPKQEPHAVALPDVDDVESAQEALADLPGFSGVTRRGEVVAAIFAAAPSASVAQQAVQRSRDMPIKVRKPDRLAELQAAGWDALTTAERDEASRLIFERTPARRDR